MTDKERFEELMQSVSDRPGFDRLMNYIRKRFLYSSGKYPLSFILRGWPAAAQPECL